MTRPIRASRRLKSVHFPPTQTTAAAGPSCSWLLQLALPNGPVTLGVGTNHAGWMAERVLDAALDRLAEVLLPSPDDWAARERLVTEHLRRLREQLRHVPAVRVCTFGSSLSGLCLAGSDLDIGLFGHAGPHGDCPLEALGKKPQRSLLNSALRAVQDARLARHKVQAIWGARVPVLKYTCALSGLDCDISLQGCGALLKARVMQMLNRHCRLLGRLYSLVKAWAAAHDLNDASRSTFNSTTLLYLVIFHLQRQGLLPPLMDLVPTDQLRQPGERLLQGQNKVMWDDPQQLSWLLGVMEARLTAWQQQHTQGHAAVPGLSSLLAGFFQRWAGRMSDWVLGRNRHGVADLWIGGWGPDAFEKPYLARLQDPFDARDSPARALGSFNSDSANGGTAAFAAFVLSSSARVLARCSDNWQAAAAAGSSDGASGSSLADWSAEPEALQQHELCRALGWLFGPDAVMRLRCQTLQLPAQQQQVQQQQRRLEAAGLPAWAICPFPQHVVRGVQNLLCSQQRQSLVLAWLVDELGAALDPANNILDLSQLQLLTRTSGKAAAAAGGGDARKRGAKTADGSSSGAAANAAAGAGEGQQQQQQRQEARQHCGSSGSSPGSSSSTIAGPQQQQQRPAVVTGQQQQQQQVAVVDCQQQQQKQGPVVAMQGPALPEPDKHLIRLQLQLADELAQLQHKQRLVPGAATPRRLPKSVRKLVQAAVKQVLLVMRSVQQRQHKKAAGSSSSSSSNGAEPFGLMAVLEQHGFTPLLEQWGFISTECLLWEQLLPSDGSNGLSQGAAAPASTSDAAAAAAAVAGQQAPSSSSRSRREQQPRLGHDSLKALSALYKLMYEQQQQQQTSPAAASMPSYEYLELPASSTGGKAQPVVRVCLPPLPRPAGSSCGASSGQSQQQQQQQQPGQCQQQLQYFTQAHQIDVPSRVDRYSMGGGRAAAKAALQWLQQQPGVMQAMMQQQQQQQQQQQALGKQQAAADRQQQRQQQHSSAVQQPPDDGTAAAAAAAAAAQGLPHAQQHHHHQKQRSPPGRGTAPADGSVQQPRAYAGAAQAGAAAEAARRERQLRDQLRSLQQSIARRQQQLAQEEELQQELLAEQQALAQQASSGRGGNRTGRQEERAPSSSNGDGGGGAGDAAAASAQAGDKMLALAMQQSTEAARKQLRQELKQCRLKIQQGHASLAKQKGDLQHLQRELAASSVASAADALATS